MKLFHCENCQNLLFFDNTLCQQCQSQVGFNPVDFEFAVLHDNNRVATQETNNGNWHYCANHKLGSCNWLVMGDSNLLCQCCQLNRYIPNLTFEKDQQQWQEFEQAKHRLVYTLLKLNLPVESKLANSDNGIAFDFIDTEKPVPEDAVTTTGHAEGQITITANEADPVQREQNRVDLNESYRTLLGHLRHEIGHYYWDRLIADNSELLANYRNLFGDEQQDYSNALEQHYQNGPPLDWAQNFVSAYASSHPWEDWAETWAHYLHLVDLLETTGAFNLTIKPGGPQTEHLTVENVIDPFHATDGNAIFDQAVPVSIALNSLSRSLGQQDLYPFVLTPAIREKLQFIHQTITQQR